MLRFALGDHQQLKAGRVHFADARQIEFERLARTHCVEQLALGVERVVDREIGVDGQAADFSGSIVFAHSFLPVAMSASQNNSTFGPLLDVVAEVSPPSACLWLSRWVS